MTISSLTPKHIQFNQRPHFHDTHFIWGFWTYKKHVLPSGSSIYHSQLLFPVVSTIYIIHYGSHDLYTGIHLLCCPITHVQGLDRRLQKFASKPQFVKDLNVIQGDGEAGSIEQVNFNEASPFKYLKHRIDVLHKENLLCKYTLIEGDPLGDKLESIGYEVKFEATSGGGCVCKMTTNYNTIGEFDVKEEEVKEGRESTIATYKVVESYLQENPKVYA